MSAPQWSPVDDDTADLLTLVADAGHVSADYEWDIFLDALDRASEDGYVSANQVRELVRGKVAPRRIGAFYNRALAEGRIVWQGEWETSSDLVGRNSGKPIRVYRRVR